MKIHTVKSAAFNKPELPETPFMVKLASPDDWLKLLDDYPELERHFQWLSKEPLRENIYRAPYRFFHSNGDVTQGEYDSKDGWGRMEYP